MKIYRNMKIFYYIKKEGEYIIVEVGYSVFEDYLLKKKSKLLVLILCI